MPDPTPAVSSWTGAIYDALIPDTGAEWQAWLAAYRQKNGRDPGLTDLSHMLYQRLREHRTPEDILRIVRGEPAQGQPWDPPFPGSPSYADLIDNVAHGPGPVLQQIVATYRQQTGRDPAFADFRHWIWRMWAEGWPLEKQLLDLQGLPHDHVAFLPVPVATVPVVEAPIVWAGPIRRTGRRFVTDAGTFRPRFVSAFRLLSRWAAEQAHCERFLDWAVATGFNGVRVLGGGGWLKYPWTPAHLILLSEFLLAAKARGLYVELTAFCNTVESPVPDKHAVIAFVAKRCAAAGNVLLEIGNETWHPTQDSQMHDVAFLKSLYQTAKSVAPSLLVALGAAKIDELDVTTKKYPNAGGDYCTVHLARKKPLVEQVSRVRELEKVSAVHNVPVISNESLGADEQLSQKQRYIDPDFAFVHGLYCRIAELGAVHHAEHGLQADLPGPNQQRCASAFIAGATLGLEYGELTFRNAREAGSPVKEANFKVDKSGNVNLTGTVWRTPAGIRGTRGIVAAIGVSGNRNPGIQWNGNWHAGTTLADRPMVKVYEIST